MHIVKRSLLLGVMLLVTIVSARADVIKGRILDVHNKSVKNTEVMVVTFGDTLAHPRFYTLHADAAGRFQAEVKSEYRGVYGRIYATAPGMAPIGFLLGRSSAHKENVLHLRPAATVSGRVIDSAGKAVSNVVVQLEILGYQDDSSIVFLANTPWEKRYQAVTDKNGKWELHCVPQNVTAGIVIIDPRFVRTIIRATTSSSPPTTRVRPGAIFAGRVITESGNPAADISVYAEIKGDTHRTINAKTTADGSYQLTGLSNGIYNITVDVPDQSMVARTIEDQIAREGKITRLPDIILVSGGIIKGQVLNKKTGQPISGIQITSYDKLNPRNRTAIIGALTDDKGYYSIRVLPGENQVFLTGASSYFQGSDFSKIFDVKEGQTITHNFILNPFEAISGIVADEQGNPVKDVEIVVSPVSELLSDNTGHGVMTSSDAKGNWKTDGLMDGEMMVRAVDPWRNLQPVKVTLPYTGTIHLTVQNINSLPPTGRVVDINNRPLKNILLRLQYQLPVSDAGREVDRYQSVTSDEYGNVRFTAPTGTQTVVIYGISINKPEYKFVRGGAWNTETQHLSDIVIDKLDNVVRGTVLNADGKPAAKVRVQAAGFDNIITHTNSLGNFELRGLPHQHLTLLATSGKAVAKASDTTTLRLGSIHHNLPSEKQALDMLESLWHATTYKEFPGRLGIIPAIAKYDPSRALKLIEDKDETIPASQISGVIYVIEKMKEADAREVLAEVKGKIPDRNLYQAIDKLAKTYPALALQWGGEHVNDVADDGDKVKVLSKLAELAAGRDDALAQKYFSQALTIANTFPAPTQKTFSSDESSNSPMGRFLYSRIQLAAASAKVHPDETHRWVMQLLPYSVDPHRGSRGGYDEVRDVLTQKLVAVGATQEVEYLIAHSTPNLQYMELGSAVSSAIVAKDINTAQKYLDQLLQIYQQKITTKPDSFITPQYTVSSAIGAMIDAVGSTDPARALKLARLIQDKDELGGALMLAGLYQSKEMELRTYEEAYSLLESQEQSPVILCKLAAMIYDLDPIKGKVLLDELLESHPVVRQRTSYPGSLQASDLATALARYKPATGWLLLQNVWEHNVTSTDSQSRDLGSIAVSMGQIDFNQAMQWARSIPGKQWGTNELDPSRKYDAQLAILREVLNPERRLTHLEVM